MSKSIITGNLIVVISATYVSFQTILVAALSIYGFRFVKDSILQSDKESLDNEANSNLPNDTSIAMSPLSNDDSEISSNAVSISKSPMNEKAPLTKNSNKINKDENKDDLIETITKQKAFLKAWIKVVWKLRNVYASFAVHTFDITTDIIVIITWWYEESNNNDEENIDTRIMAIASIGIMVVHKIISSLAIWVKQKDIVRALLQLFDLLIFEEIYHAHKNVISILTNKQSAKDIDSTMTFKYIRSMEAIFESMPQAVLQLVYVMRTSTFDWIFIISILQSVISMTNSVLKDDNSRGMYGERWKKHKKRLPPTLPFLKHAIARLSQVVSRICILSLIWTIVGGLGFTIVCGIEVLFTFVQFILFDHHTWNDAFLFSSLIIITPPELIFEQGLDRTEFTKTICGCIIGNGCEETCGYFCVGYVFCIAWGAILSRIMSCKCQSKNYGYQWTSIRLGFSFMEIILIIVFGILDYMYEEQSNNFLFWEWKHSLIIFIICIVSFLVDCAYLRLFPNFSLPNGISARSEFGYAFSGELIELQKLQTRGIGCCNKYKILCQYIVTNICCHNKHDSKTQKNNDKEKYQFMYDGDTILYALANKHYHIVRWLEEQGAKDHINQVTQLMYTPQEARQMIDDRFVGWID